MLFWNKICGFTIIFFILALSGVAQSKIGTAFSKEMSDKNNLLIKPPAFSLTNQGHKLTLHNSYYFNVIPQNYYTQHFGIMCKKELLIEKATKIPFRFRLGSLQQCNYLEGKR